MEASMPSDIELLIQLLVSGTSSSWYCLLWSRLSPVLQRLWSIVEYYRLAWISSLSTLHDAKEWADSRLFRLWKRSLCRFDSNPTIYTEAVVFLPWLDVSRAWKGRWNDTESMEWPGEIIRGSKSLVVFVSNIVTDTASPGSRRDATTISTLCAPLVRRCRISKDGEASGGIQAHSRKETTTISLA